MDLEMVSLKEMFVIDQMRIEGFRNSSLVYNATSSANVH